MLPRMIDTLMAAPRGAGEQCWDPDAPDPHPGAEDVELRCLFLAVATGRCMGSVYMDRRTAGRQPDTVHTQPCFTPDTPRPGSDRSKRFSFNY